MAGYEAIAATGLNKNQWLDGWSPLQLYVLFMVSCFLDLVGDICTPDALDEAEKAVWPLLWDLQLHKTPQTDAERAVRTAEVEGNVRVRKAWQS